MPDVFESVEKELQKTTTLTYLSAGILICGAAFFYLVFIRPYSGEETPAETATP